MPRKKQTTETTIDTTAKSKAKPQRPSKAAADNTAQVKKLSAIDAAAKVLADAAEPMNTQQLIEAMSAKGYWTSPGGKTPHATLYSAIAREIKVKGKDARFRKTDRGLFARAAS